MCEMDRASQFVNQQVQHFSKRHMEKLCEVYPTLSKQELILASGNKALIAAVENTITLEKTIARMVAELNEVSAIYAQKFGATVEELLNKAQEERQTIIDAKQKNFEFRIREAIGLVELVSSADAFNVLNSCRNEIEMMGKK